MRWDEFERACPELAEEGRRRFVADQLVLLGTNRKDGWPRISPCEVDLAAGHLFLGMMWRSMKALDLHRDPRVVVHTVQCDREAAQGDLKLYGQAVEITDAALRAAFRQAIKARINWAPEEPRFHLFSLDIAWASLVTFGERQTILRWDPSRGLRTQTRTHA
jgi:hypothetical protein